MYHESLRLFAAYNAWANERLYAAAVNLGPDRWRQDRGVFFGSMLGTLNHILAADQIWMRRITGIGEAPDRLDAILFDDLEPLRAARVAEDHRISAYVTGLSEDDLTSTFTYTPITRPQPIMQQRGPVMLHIFNHQTHHRGQAHAILTGFGLDAPSLDMILFQREQGTGIN